MFTGTNHRLPWLVATPVAVAFLGFGIFVWATLSGNAPVQIVTAVSTVVAAAAQYLLLERSRLRERRRMLDLVRVLNRPGDLRELIVEVTRFMKDWSGCQAVGVRLADGDDFPYYETRGFAAEFVEAERHLCRREADGTVLRDGAGHPVLDCMCGCVLRGRFDPAKPFFTAKGSFCSNHTSKLLATTSEADRQGRTRNRCNGEGYESVALIPLRAHEQTFGLLQFNDGSKGKLPRRKMRFLEEVADVIALSLGQRSAQQRLAHNEGQYRQIVETADEGILTLDAAGTVVYLNARSAVILGTTIDAARGRDIRDFMLPEDVPVHDNRWRQRSAGRSEKYEACVIRSDGSQAWCLVSARPNFGVHGEFLGSFAMISDISERKRAEEERQRLQAQLIQAQKLESIGRLAGGVAHDFNNMLSVINGHAEMALEQIPSSDPLHDDLWNILNAGRRSATLTRQLLAFARQQTIQPRVVDLNQLVTSMLKLLGRLIGEDIELVWAPAPTLWRVRVDPAQIDQILANLAVNARDAIAGVGKLSLATANQELSIVDCATMVGSAPGRYVRLSVSDTGCGMDKDIIEHIFEPFFTTKKVGEGTGLGLATVYGVVRQNHGFISVYSEPGQGTTFNIYLPRCESALTTSAENEAVAEVTAGHETVLVVEDEEAVLSLVQGRLEEEGYKVIAANSPETAVRLSAEHGDRIDLLLTDLVMPGMDGRALARRIAQERPQLKCLFMSGYPADVAAHHGLMEAGLRLIQKPFSLRSLSRTVRQVLDGSGARHHS